MPRIASITTVLPGSASAAQYGTSICVGSAASPSAVSAART
ncbi:MAG TPA: hypothetical protein VK817_16815 [Trebonia sp.]|nr:hypothetical protein [Trebonia sp.]